MKSVYSSTTVIEEEPLEGMLLLEGGGGGLMEGQLESPGSGGTPVPQWELISVTKFVWDGWNLTAELDGDDDIVRTYAWGLDMSGSEQGAGGVGGLLFEQDGDGGPIHRVSMDGNGNVMTLRDSTGTLIAGYEYGPFGEALTVRGSYAGINPFRFSTKYNDSESGLYYYGYRYYSTGMGRWISRDPLQESGALNLLSFAANSPQTTIDILGLDDYTIGSRDPRIVIDPGAGPWNSRAPKAGDYELFQVLYNASWPATLKTPNAARHLRHYLNNSGVDKHIDLKQMLRDSESELTGLQFELAQATRFAETQSSDSFQITSQRARGEYVSRSENEDWFFAMGGYHRWGKGRVTKCADKYMMDFEYKIFDRYNWDTGKSTKILPGITLSDDDIGGLHLSGMACEYNIRGSLRLKVEWSRGAMLHQLRVTDETGTTYDLSTGHAGRGGGR